MKQDNPDYIAFLKASILVEKDEDTKFKKLLLQVIAKSN